MIKELIATIGIISTIGTNPPLNANDGTYYQDVTITETYEYETNEVNSVDDLVVGNIYKATFNSVTTNTELCKVSYFRYVSEDWYSYQDIKTNSVCGFNLGMSFDEYRFQLYSIYNGNNQVIYLPVNDITLPFYFVFENYNQNTMTYLNITTSDYLGEKTITITPHETEGLYNLGYHFLVTRIYTNGELANMSVSIFGTTLNINQWLAHTTALAITILLLIVLIKFVIWLFKVVSGTFIWR